MHLADLHRLAELPQKSACLERCDPLGLLRRAAVDEAGAACSPHEVFLAWLLSLPAEVDPSIAAGAMLARFETASCAVRAGSDQRRLMQLLEETASWPRSALETLVRRRGGQGGRR